MTYSFSEDLGVLKTWLASHGVNTKTLLSERQAAFHAQKVAGTFHKFPGKGQSCRNLLLGIQAAVVKQSQDRRSEPAKIVNHQPSMTDWWGAGEATIARSGRADHVFYIDGCCSPNPGAGGWAYVDFHDGYESWAEFGGEIATTNSRMELTALLRCLDWIWVRFSDEPTIVHTDSQYALKVATVWGATWAARGWKRKGGEIENIDLVKRIHENMQGLPHVTIEWVRGTDGDVGNERADELAEHGRMKSISGGTNG